MDSDGAKILGLSAAALLIFAYFAGGSNSYSYHRRKSSKKRTPKMPEAAKQPCKTKSVAKSRPAAPQIIIVEVEPKVTVNSSNKSAKSSAKRTVKRRKPVTSSKIKKVENKTAIRKKRKPYVHHPVMIIDTNISKGNK